MNSISIRILFATFCLWAIPAQAQSDWPSRQVEIVVPFPPGGGYDTVARPLADYLSKKFNQQFIVVNKPGAVGMIGAKFVASAKPDGYTLLLTGSGPGLNNMLTQKSITYNPIKDLTPIIVLCEFPMIIAAKKDFPANNLKEFVAYAKANPGKVDYATSGFGAQGHLTAALFILKTDIEMTMVPFQGSGPASVALVGGHVQATFDSLAAYVPHIKSGAIKAFAVTTAQRAASIPDVPTVREAGFPEVEAGGWQGLSGPAGMSPEIVNKINAAAREFLAAPEGKQMALNAGMNNKGGSPQEMTAFLQEELKKWEPAVKAANIIQ